MERNETIEKTLTLAKRLQESSLKKSDATTFSKRLKPLLNYPKAKTFLIHLMDVTFRSSNLSKVADFVKRMFESKVKFRVLFTDTEFALVRVYRMVGYLVPQVSIPLMRSQIRDVSENIVFEKDSDLFHKHIKKRKSQNVASNINLIGEALLGKEEAELRIQQYIDLLRSKSVNYVSVKISTIYSQIEPLAHQETLNELINRLSILYDELITIHEKTGEWKFVNLDMEEYRDLSLTVDAFIETLSLDKYKNLYAGIVLQAYLPDSYDWLIKIQEWAAKRVEDGGAPIKIRVVKGANMEMEKTEASTQGWSLVTYDRKIDTDSNYKKMLLRLLTSYSCKSIHVGVASHNVFDIAFALTLAKEQNIEDAVDIEMLEGMAGNLVKEVQDLGGSVLLYTPVVDKKQYMSAIAYLVRRLDEGTQDGNYLKEGFQLPTDSRKWESLQSSFLESYYGIGDVLDKPRRQQDRANEVETIQADRTFENTPDTDWILPQNQEWIKSVIKKWQGTPTINGESYVPIVGSVDQKERKKIRLENWQGKTAWEYELADADDYRKVIEDAKESTWLDLTPRERVTIIRNAALELQKQRGDLIGVGMEEVGKLIRELDPEISEAVDFANFYAYSMEKLLDESNQTYESRGMNLVLSPWNFPVAISAGGVLASLVTGNTVILKPSMNAAACSYVMCQCLWRAGIPKSALAFLPTDESVLDEFLAEGDTFSAVILTGGTDTAKFLLKRNPHLNLFAETGGKNATIVSSLSDYDQVIKHVLHSAFGNAGQKCSATSLLILEEDVFNDAHFKKLLKDGLESRKVGSPYELDSVIGPLAMAPNEKIQKSLKETPDSQWLVKPTVDGQFMTPGIKWGITTEDFEYSNELFGPVLSVMKAKNLNQAMKLVNDLDYGLTSGLESLDEDEITKWKNTIMAGNLYINRSTTGAIVQRQPFGGMKASCFGFGMKAGGLNYVTQFLKSAVQVDSGSELAYAEKNFKKWYDEHFSREIDYSHVRGEYNTSRYLKPDQVVVTVDSEVTENDLWLVQLACKTLAIPMTILHTDNPEVLEGFPDAPKEKLKSWDELTNYFSNKIVIRALNKTRIDESVLKKAHDQTIHLYGYAPKASGRFELLNYLTEQSISYSYHRYGNLMGKEVI